VQLIINMYFTIVLLRRPGDSDGVAGKSTPIRDPRHEIREFYRRRGRAGSRASDRSTDPRRAARGEPGPRRDPRGGAGHLRGASPPVAIIAALSRNGDPT
jgi:hypothetical protein